MGSAPGWTTLFPLPPFCYYPDWVLAVENQRRRPHIFPFRGGGSSEVNYCPSIYCVLILGGTKALTFCRLQALVQKLFYLQYTAWLYVARVKGERAGFGERDMVRQCIPDE